MVNEPSAEKILGLLVDLYAHQNKVKMKQCKKVGGQKRAGAKQKREQRLLFSFFREFWRSCGQIGKLCYNRE